MFIVQSKILYEIVVMNRTNKGGYCSSQAVATHESLVINTTAF